MKQTLLTLLVFLFSVATLAAQDIIMKRTGEKLEAKVLEISPTEIKYKQYDRLEGPTYILPKSEVAVIQYANNTSEAFALEDTTPPASVASKPALSEMITEASSGTSNLAIYAKGQSDATAFYDGYQAAGTGTLVSSLVNPLFGLIPAVACSVTTPKKHNLDAPNHELLEQPDYVSGYRKQARKIKSGKVWKNWGIGLGVNILLAVILVTQ
ncbi:hypothetical protein CLV24_109126 [Pontibacter ummariensis]|uniref:Uncharacterized protein n=1 Tax=Pontibacter ummariensis TaxID=1610492 RepID=A0A239FQJ6_9BACT|nr:hypothetical protein [Pontibacter ummariensis]PRY12001.1 hypothetical protein CLV24_109126 [Pontibacter ummariensis]SNS58174.1 hypothetical protein SAMN06296052_10944 [Pontibacter ummariensis]